MHRWFYVKVWKQLPHPVLSHPMFSLSFFNFYIYIIFFSSVSISPPFHYIYMVITISLTLTFLRLFAGCLFSSSSKNVEIPSVSKRSCWANRDSKKIFRSTEVRMRNCHNLFRLGCGRHLRFHGLQLTTKPVHCKPVPSSQRWWSCGVSTRRWSVRNVLQWVWNRNERQRGGLFASFPSQNRHELSRGRILPNPLRAWKGFSRHAWILSP